MAVNRLRTRLIASYLVVLLVTLVVISLLLVLILRAQPVAAEPIFNRLSAVMRVVNNRGDQVHLLLNARPENLTRILDGIALQTRVRILVVRTNGLVVYDSLGEFEPQSTVDARLWGPPAGELALVRGSFSQEGAEWLFVAQQYPTLAGETLFALAEPRPASSWTEVLNIFGSSLLAPLIVAGLVGLGLALAVAWALSRGLVQSLGRLAAGAGAIAAGHYGERVPVLGAEEIRGVATAFNHMAEQVQTAQVTQQDFLANVSHDLRTPLTSIQGFSQAIIDGTSKDPAYHARIIHDEVGRLNRMVGELLDLARISAGRLSMTQGRVDLAQVAHAVAERLAIKASEGGVRLFGDIKPVPEVAGDGDRLAQVITNLIDNALKFTPQGGEVRIAVVSDRGGVQVAVSDTGHGIPPEDLPRVFERFYQVDKARGPRRGTGLGLTITAEIVHAHGGQISAASAGRDQGTTFTCWFPAMGMSTIVRRV